MTNDLEIMIKTAELYYLEDMPQREIAAKLNLSRPKVSRLLKAARENNLIEIKINYPKTIRSTLEKTFEQEFGLKEAIIIKNNTEDTQRSFALVTNAAARYLLRAVKAGDTLGVAWGRTLSGVVDALGLNPKKEVKVVQLIGSLGQSAESANEIVRKVSVSFGGAQVLLPAPAIVDTAEIKEVMLKDNTICDALRTARSVDTALVGIGNVGINSSFFHTDFIKEKDLDILKKCNAVGDICAHFFDIEGNLCNYLDDRVMAVEFGNLKKIPQVIGVALGKEKAAAILGALKTQILDVLITDEHTATLISDNIN